MPDFLGLVDTPAVANPATMEQAAPQPEGVDCDEELTGHQLIEAVIEQLDVCHALLDRDSVPADIDNPILRGATRMKQLAEVHESAKKLVKRLDDEYDRLRLKELPELMIQDDIKTVTYAGVGRVQLGADVYASIPAPSREEAYTWLRENNAGDLITETVNSSTLKAWCRERVAMGEELPECFKVTPFSRVSIVKGK